MRRPPLFAPVVFVVALAPLPACSITSLFGSAVLCDVDAACPADERCTQGVCRPPEEVGEGEGEGEGEAGEGEGEGGEGEGEGDEGEGEGEGEGDAGEGEGEGDVGEGEGEGEALCGNDTIDSGESCDDGNDADDDGCDADCAPSAVVQLAAGNAFTCALLRSEHVRCWGKNDRGQLGVAASFTGLPLPRDVDALRFAGGVRVIAAGGDTACAVDNVGGVHCWGSNAFGALGRGAGGDADANDVGDDERADDVGAVALADAAVDIAVGAHHVCAVTAAGDVFCWGQGDAGRLGSGDEANLGNDEPANAAPAVPVGPASRVAAGGSHSCAITAAGAACWGDNDNGQLGNDSTQNAGNRTPIVIPAVFDLPAPPLALAAGGKHTCVIDEGDVRCAGNGADGRLGYGNINELHALGPAVPFGADAAVAVCAGDAHTCVIDGDGGVRCWGAGSRGRLGYGNNNSIGDSELPLAGGAVALGGRVVSLACGFAHTCALLGGGDVVCWGDGEAGALGNGSANDVGDDELPTSQGRAAIF